MTIRKDSSRYMQKTGISESMPTAGLTAEERHQLIAKIAYHRAERRGFTPGSELADWLEAEKEVRTAQERRRAEQTSTNETTPATPLRPAIRMDPTREPRERRG